MGEVHEIGTISYLRQPGPQVATAEDLHMPQKDILLQLKKMIDNAAAKPAKKWLKSYEVELLLGLSPNTLLHYVTKE